MIGPALLAWFVFSWIACARIIRFGKVLSRMALRSVALLDALLSPLEEDEKIDEVQSRTAQLMGSLFRVLGFIAALVLLGMGVDWGLDVMASRVVGMNGSNEIRRSFGWELLAASLGALPPWFLFTRKNRGADFSPLSVLIHRIAFDHPNIAWRLFQREVRSRKAVPSRPDFLLITGLARAGTTSMLNHVSRIERFDSLSYANLPFLLAPNLWRRFYNPARGEAIERSHKDGVLIHHRSVEALEEYFFKVITSDQFIDGDRLVPHDLTPDQAAQTLDYHRLIRSSPEKIYLAKNNNALLRYPSMRAKNTDFHAVIMFRHPLYHAASLLDKHIQYTELQGSNPFVLEMMNWLGHHEFGRGHKPMVWNEKPPTGSPSTLDYWLQVWTDYYRHALTVDDENCLWVDYANFCSNPSEVIDQVLAPWGESWSFEGISSYNNERAIEHQHAAEILEQAMQLYSTLQEKVRQGN